MKTKEQIKQAIDAAHNAGRITYIFGIRQNYVTACAKLETFESIDVLTPLDDALLNPAPYKPTEAVALLTSTALHKSLCEEELAWLNKLATNIKQRARNELVETLLWTINRAAQVEAML